jgi:molybdopterin-guanine dinucleotide biosynthesis protein A
VTARSGQPDLGAVVLTGGGGVRLGGADKATIEVGGQTLLEHALAALDGVPEVVVVGSEVPTSRPVTFTREDPPGGGPAAGLLAGLGRFARQPAYVVALAVDMPLVTTDTVARLTAAVQLPGVEGAVLVDAAGRQQYLCAAYSVAALARAAQEADETSGHGLSMRRLLGQLRLETVPAVGAESQDLDTWEDLARLRENLGEEEPPGPERHG